MPTRRTAALLLAFAIGLGGSLASHADQAAPSDEQAIDHIRLLERMLRDAGVDPPTRPSALADAGNDEAEPILPPSFATTVFETEAAAINARSDKAATAIKYVRRWLEKDDVKRRVAAQDIMDTLTKWANVRLAKIETTRDPVAAYILADDTIHLLEQDPLGKPFKRYVQNLQRDRSAWHDLVSMAAYRRALEQAQDVGLLDDWALIDFQNTDVRLTIKTITAKFKLITNNWPSSEASQLAQAKLKDWQDREAQAIADLPAWRYTWQLDLINIGTEKTTTIITKPDGTIIFGEDIKQVYDPEKVLLYGTFQNTSDKPYRYTFLAAVTSQGFFKVPFNELKKNQLSGFELIQTPLLQPGELFKWEAFVAVDSIHNLHRGGVTMVEIRERR